MRVLRTSRQQRCGVNEGVIMRSASERKSERLWVFKSCFSCLIRKENEVECDYDAKLLGWYVIVMLDVIGCIHFYGGRFSFQGLAPSIFSG